MSRRSGSHGPHRRDPDRPGCREPGCACGCHQCAFQYHCGRHRLGCHQACGARPRGYQGYPAAIDVIPLEPKAIYRRPRGVTVFIVLAWLTAAAVPAAWIYLTTARP